MDYLRMSYFLKAAETLNFTKAAEAMYVSRQAFAKQISNFEEELGARLFERNTREVTLTTTGQKLFERLNNAYEEMKVAMAEGEALCKSQHEIITVGIFVDINSNIIDRVTEYLLSFPGITINPVILDLHDIKYQLYEGKIDICLTFAVEEEKWPRCEMSVLHTHKSLLIVSNKHPWNKLNRPLTIEDMREEDYVMLKGGRDETALFFSTIPCKSEIWVPNIQSIMIRLASGKGFAITSEYSASTQNKDYSCFKIPQQEVEFHFVCIWRKEELRQSVLNTVDKINGFLKN